MTEEYPGVSRLIVEWTDPDEIAFNWPFNANGREVRSVAVDGVEYVDAEKLKATNGELCAEVNELEKRIAELEVGKTCSGTLDFDNWFICSNCGCQTKGDQYGEKPNYCASCGRKVVDA